MDRQTTIDTIVESFSTLTRLMKMCFHTMLEEETLTPSHIHILFVLKHEGALSARQLSQALFLSPGAVTQLVEPLVDEGLLQRRSSPDDRRQVFLSLSPKGKKELSRLEAKRSKLLAGLAEPLSAKELEIMVSVQQKFIDGLKERCTDFKANRKET